MLYGVMEWIAVGLIVGFIVSKIIFLHGDDPRIGILFGGAGGLLGGWIYSLVSGVAVGPYVPASLMFAAIGAVIALAVFHIKQGGFSRT